jgi:dihydropteroate synthase
MLKRIQQQSPLVMGILNVTPDSFSDGGKFSQPDAALKQVEEMIEHGVDIIDIGGESTRPGAELVSADIEISRVIPLLSAIKKRFNVLVSVDTNKAVVMQQAIDAGADMINDVMALQNDGALEVMANTHLPICLMHMQGLPSTMQKNPKYQQVTQDIIHFFQQRIAACEQAGIARERLIIDPGFGFGKTLEQNYQLLAELECFKSLNLPVLVGLSRKSMIGNLLDRAVDERLAGSLACAVIAAQKGAHIIRVHDVKETADAINIVKKVQQYQSITTMSE